MNNASEIEKRAKEVSPMSLFGASAMVFPDKISTVRGVMGTRHTSQRVVLRNPEFARVFTGAENEFGDRSSWNIKAKDDYKLVKTFRKFKDSAVSPVAYIFKNLRTGKYSCEIVKPAHHLVEKYGFRMNNAIHGKFNDGDILPKGTTIAQSSSYVNDNYCAGRNLRMVYTVKPELTEDALVISDRAAEALAYDMVDIVTVNIKQSSFLLNKYGNDQLYKPFPNVGEEIQNDILCSIRENSYLSSASEALIPHINDTNYCSHGIVVDMDIYSNVDVDNEQYNYYLGQIRDWYSDIYAFISTIVVDPYQDDTSLLDIYHQAEKYLNTSKWVTKEDIVDTVIKFTILQPKDIHVGQKVVGRYGNKSVIAQIIPWQLMPRTKDGRPIDMLCNALAVPNRIIAFATYESSMTFMMERMWEHILEMDKNKESRESIMNLAIEFVSTFNPEQGEELKRVYNEAPEETYADLIRNGFYIQIQPLNEKCVRDSLIESYEKWPDIMKYYKIEAKLRHRWVELDGEYPVGYQYTWVLKQEPSKAMSTVATGRTTLYDQPVKTRRYNKNLIPYSDNPIKYGEYDTYNFLAGMGVKAFAKISTYYRGSQYEDNSMLMSQLNGIGIDTTKYNQFPQLDNLKNILKLLGTKLKTDVYWYDTIGNIDELHDVKIGNVDVTISIPDLHYMLIMHSYYLQYAAYKQGSIDMVDFLDQMSKTNTFMGLGQEYINYLFTKFTELLPVLQQRKQYN
jgi:DNA-directed RNA polymerase beta subunit